MDPVIAIMIVLLAAGVPTYPVTEDELNEKLDDYGDKTNRVKLPTKADITFAPGPWMTPEKHAESRRKPKKKNTFVNKQAVGGHVTNLLRLLVLSETHSCVGLRLQLRSVSF